MAKETSKLSEVKIPSLKGNQITILYILLIVAAFLIGSLYTKVSFLEKNGSTTTNTQAENTAAQQPQGQQPAPVKVDINAIKDLFKKDFIKFGDANRKVLFVEVVDPSCPFCQVAAGKNPELNKEMGGNFVLVEDGGTYIAPVVEIKKLVDEGKASFVFLYQNGHGNGELATKALYCAHDQGKFWQAHDKLMTNDGYNLINNEVKNDKANTGKLVDFLTGSVDSSALKSCLESGKYDDALSTAIQAASSLGVNGTPGFFVNETNFAGAYNWTDMKSVVDEALK
ncbi:MAG: DsbA family protein [Candidatus Levyibacteriota bacterium]